MNVICNLCDSDVWTVRFPATSDHTRGPDAGTCRCTHEGYGSHAQIVTCAVCGHVYANPRWSAEELLEAYSDVEDETYVEERVGRELTFVRHMEDLEMICGPGDGRTLLDVGAYAGVLVEAAANAGWDAWGVEPSVWAAKQAQDRGLNVIQGTLDAPELAGRAFDVITMFDVIEHVDDPVLELTRSLKLLKPGGYIVVHTMDIDSRFARVMGRRWPWLMDMHIQYFSRRTIAAMLEKVGFEFVSVQPKGRYITLAYLATRVGGFNETLGKIAGWIVDRLGLGRVAIRINLGDIFTAYGRRPL
jgi:2-polyprenyl-3-methyl-5-hydroxy-6-metoxy-1,4-benzoquinol methylase